MLDGGTMIAKMIFQASVLWVYGGETEIFNDLSNNSYKHFGLGSGNLMNKMIYGLKFNL